MFNLIVKPVIDSVKSWMSARVYAAAVEGANEGLAKFAAQLTAAAELTAPHPEAVPLVMPSAAQVTEPSGENEADQPVLDQTSVERLRELIANGMSQRAAAAELGVSPSTANRWLKSA